MKRFKYKPSLYLENSVISMYFQTEIPNLRDMTRLFWQKILPSFRVYISEVVLDEIRAIKDMSLRKEHEKLIRNFEVLELTEDILKIADTYLIYRKIPRGDALHIAVASFYGINFLVTWNLRHIYKRSTQEIVREVNTWLKISVPIIVTPEDFLKEE